MNNDGDKEVLSEADPASVTLDAGGGSGAENLSDVEMTSVDLDTGKSFDNEAERGPVLEKNEMETNNEFNVSGTNEVETLKLIEMLRSDDVSDRSMAMAQLKVIATGLGEQRTINELIPFLTESTDDEDEVLAVMAEHIGELTDYIGDESNASLLLPPMELLLMAEETTVREKAVEKTKELADNFSLNTFRSSYTKMLFKLAAKEWFTARTSACSLIAHGLNRFTVEETEKALEVFAKLCRDDVPLVRRVASSNLGLVLANAVSVLSLSSVIEPDGVINRLVIPLYEELAKNDQDSVRLQIPENCVLFAKAITENAEKDSVALVDQEHITERILPLLVSTIDDRSWRVRWTAASKFNEAVQAFCPLPRAVSDLIPAFEKLLQDPEAEVRSAATLNMADVARYGNRNESDEVADRLVKRIAVATDDESEHVRAAMALVATELAPILGKDKTLHHLLPPVLLLLRDPSSEVRLNLISSLSPLNDVVGVDLLSQSLIPAIVDLSEDNKWRIRLAIIDHIPLLAKQLGENAFNENLASLCIKWLTDDISSIRAAAATNLMHLTKLFGCEWAVKNLLPSIKNVKEHQSYLRRMTALHACTSMATTVDSQSAAAHFLPVIIEMASDAVPNIRFNVAKALEALALSCGESTYRSQILPVLSVLLEDPDRDVRYYAEQALEAAEKGLGSASSAS